MRYLMLILAFPLIVQAQSDVKECGRLKTIASELEKMIQSKNAGLACDTLPEPSDKKFDYRCKDLAAIELQLKSLDNEIAMINGVKNLRAEVLSAKATVEKTTNKAIAVEASQELFQNLKIAARVEGFLSTNGFKGENLLSVLSKGKDEDFSDPAKFQAFVAATCIDLGVTPGNAICDKTAPMDQELLNQIKGLFTLGVRTERKFNKSQIEDLKNAMAIKNGDKAYSFNEMLNSVTDPGAGAFSEVDVATLATLNVAPSSDKFKFLANIKKASGNLAASRDFTHAQGVPARFATFITDLKNRETWELKSKLSVVLKELKAEAPQVIADSCANARELDETGINNCFEAIAASKTISGLKVGAAKNIFNELRIGQKHLKKLDDVMANCVLDEQMNLNAACNEFTDDALLTLTTRATELNAVRAKILESSAALMLSRDLAVETLYSKKCVAGTQSDITNCAADLGSISREVIALTDATEEIVYMFTKPPVATDVAKICKDIPEGTSHKAELCKLAVAKPAEVVAAPKKFFTASETFEAKATPTDYTGFFGSLIQAAGSLFSPNTTVFNPYTNMYPYSINMGQPSGISNSLSGAFGYSPTPGLRPYSSVNSNVGVASAYSFGTSSYFNSPVGW